MALVGHQCYGKADCFGCLVDMISQNAQYRGICNNLFSSVVEQTEVHYLRMVAGTQPQDGRLQEVNSPAPLMLSAVMLEEQGDSQTVPVWAQCFAVACYS